MISKISEHITSFILKNADKSSEDLREIYRYGIEIFISSFLNIFLILLIGFFTNTVTESIIFLLCFVPLRQVTGGWHASTYFVCNTVFCISYILVLLFSFLFLKIKSIFIAGAFLILGFLPIILFCPVENPNKKIRNKKKMKTLAIILYLVYSSVCLFLYFSFDKYCFTLLLTLVCVSLAVIVGHILLQKASKCE